MNADLVGSERVRRQSPPPRLIRLTVRLLPRSPRLSQHRKFAQPKPFTVEKSVKKFHAEGNSNIGSSFGQFYI